MKLSTLLVGGVAALALLTAPISPAAAHGRHRDGGLLFGLFALGTAAVVGAATIATAPLRAVAAAPVYAAPMPPPQAYYAPRAYYPPPAYAVPQGYYAAPVYAAPPGYYYPANR